MTDSIQVPLSESQTSTAEYIDDQCDDGNLETGVFTKTGDPIQFNGDTTVYDEYIIDPNAPGFQDFRTKILLAYTDEQTSKMTSRTGRYFADVVLPQLEQLQLPVKEEFLRTPYGRIKQVYEESPELGVYSYRLVLTPIGRNKADFYSDGDKSGGIKVVDFTYEDIQRWSGKNIVETLEAEGWELPSPEAFISFMEGNPDLFPGSLEAQSTNLALSRFRVFKTAKGELIPLVSQTLFKDCSSLASSFKTLDIPLTEEEAIEVATLLHIPANTRQEDEKRICVDKGASANITAKEGKIYLKIVYPPKALDRTIGKLEDAIQQAGDKGIVQVNDEISLSRDTATILLTALIKLKEGEDPSVVLDYITGCSLEGGSVVLIVVAFTIIGGWFHARRFMGKYSSRASHNTQLSSLRKEWLMPKVIKAETLKLTGDMGLSPPNFDWKSLKRKPGESHVVYIRRLDRVMKALEGVISIAYDGNTEPESLLRALGEFGELLKVGGYSPNDGKIDLQTYDDSFQPGRNSPSSVGPDRQLTAGDEDEKKPRGPNDPPNDPQDGPKNDPPDNPPAVDAGGAGANQPGETSATSTADPSTQRVSAIDRPIPNTETATAGVYLADATTFRPFPVPNSLTVEQGQIISSLIVPYLNNLGVTLKDFVLVPQTLVTPEGITIPTYSMMRSADVPSIPTQTLGELRVAPGGNIPSGPSLNTPNGRAILLQGTTAVAGELTANVIIILPIELGLHLLDVPEEVHLPAIMGSLYAINLGLYKGGVMTQVPTVAAMTTGLPGMIALSSVAGMVLHKFGQTADVQTLQAGHLGNSVGSLTLGVAPYAVGRAFPALGKVAVFRAGGTLLNPLGGLMLGEVVGDAAIYSTFKLQGIMNDDPLAVADARLNKLAWSLVNQENGIELPLFGGISRGLIGVAGYFAPEAQQALLDTVDEMRTLLVSSAKSIVEQLVYDALVYAMEDSQTHAWAQSFTAERQTRFVSFIKGALTAEEREKDGFTRLIFMVAEALGEGSTLLDLFSRSFNEDGKLLQPDLLDDLMEVVVDKRLRDLRRGLAETMSAKTVSDIIDKTGYVIQKPGNMPELERARIKLSKELAFKIGLATPENPNGDPHFRLSQKEADDLLALGVNPAVVFDLYRLSGLLAALTKPETLAIARSAGFAKPEKEPPATKFLKPLTIIHRDEGSDDTNLMIRAAAIGEPVARYLENHSGELEEVDDATLTGVLNSAGHPELAARVLREGLSEEERLLLLATAMVAIETRAPELLDKWQADYLPFRTQGTSVVSRPIVGATPAIVTRVSPTLLVLGQ